MELREVWRRVCARPWLVPALALLGLLGGLVYGHVAPKMYAADSEVFLGARLGDGSQASDVSPVQLKSYAMAVTSNLILDPAAKKLALGSTDDLRDMISVSVPTGTSIISVEADASDPRKAADAANAVVASMLSQGPQLYPVNSRGDRAVEARVLSPAGVPTLPDSPKRTMAAAVGLVVGALVGLLAALVPSGSLRRRSDAASHVRGRRLRTGGDSTRRPLRAPESVELPDVAGE